MSGKGDRNRVSDWDKFYEGYNRVFRPQEPFYTDVKEYESRFRGGNIDSTKVLLALVAKKSLQELEQIDWTNN